MPCSAPPERLPKRAAVLSLPSLQGPRNFNMLATKSVTVRNIPLDVHNALRLLLV